MAKPSATTNFIVSDVVLDAFAINDRINQYMIENLPAEAWRAEPPGGKGRDAAIVAHMHSVRVMWLKAAAQGSRIPEQLDLHKLTPPGATKGLERSRAALSAILQESLESDERVKGFKPDLAAFFGYLVDHGAHLRRQVGILARQVGQALPQKVLFGWREWGTH